MGHSQWDDEQGKIIDSCATVLVNLVATLETIPYNKDATELDSSFLQVSPLAHLLGKCLGPQKKQRLTNLGQALDTLHLVDSQRRDMLHVENYETTVPAVEQVVVTLEKLFVGGIGGAGTASESVLSGSPFEQAVMEFVRACKHDCTKARESLGQQWDEHVAELIKKLNMIAGGARGGAVWLDTWNKHGGTTLPQHVAETLNKVDAQQLVDAVSSMQDSLKLYTATRADSQLHCVIFKTIAKSSKPQKRLETAIVAFDTEKHVQAGVCAYTSVGDVVREFLHQSYGLFSTPPITAPAAKAGA